MTTTNPSAGFDVPVAEVTSTFVITVDRSMSLRDVAAHLSNTDVSFVIVDEAGSVAGVISERDIVLAVSEGAAFDEVRAEDIMSTDLVTVGPRDDMHSAARQMLDEGVRHLIVTGDEGGVVSMRDVLAALVG